MNMNRAQRTELKLITKFIGYLDKGEEPINRWRWAGRALTAFGSFIMGMCIFSSIQAKAGALGFVLVGCLGGLLVGTGVIFTLSAQQWPIFSRFLDIERLRARASELKNELQ
jgi:hypothetical protein